MISRRREMFRNLQSPRHRAVSPVQFDALYLRTSVDKTIVRHLVQWFRGLLRMILERSQNLQVASRSLGSSISRFNIHEYFDFPQDSSMNSWIPGLLSSHGDGAAHGGKENWRATGDAPGIYAADLQRIFRDPLELECRPENYDQSNRRSISSKSRAKSRAPRRMLTRGAHQSAPVARLEIV